MIMKLRFKKKLKFLYHEGLNNIIRQRLQQMLNYSSYLKTKNSVVLVVLKINKYKSSQVRQMFLFLFYCMSQQGFSNIYKYIFSLEYTNIQQMKMQNLEGNRSKEKI